MNSASFALLCFLLLGEKSASFLPQQATLQRPATKLGYKEKRDEIAHEILDLQKPGTFQKSKTHDANPWKEALEEEHETVTSLDHELKVEKIQHEKRVRKLEEKMAVLFGITEDLAVKDLEMAAKIKELEEERNSLRKMTRRVFRLLADRVKSRLGKIKNGLLRGLGLRRKTKNDS